MQRLDTVALRFSKKVRNRGNQYFERTRDRIVIAQRNKELAMGIYFSATRAEQQTSIALWISLSVATIFLLVTTILIVRFLKRKERDNSLYSMARSDFQPEFFPEQDKKSMINGHSNGTSNGHGCYDYSLNKQNFSMQR